MSKRSSRQPVAADLRLSDGGRPGSNGTSTSAQRLLFPEVDSPEGPIGYTTRLLVATTLPRSRSDDNEFTRSSGIYDLCLLTPRRVGLPFGRYQRARSRRGGAAAGRPAAAGGHCRKIISGGAYGVGGVAALLDRDHRRLGDVLADTLVVEERPPLTAPERLALAERRQICAAAPAVLRRIHHRVGLAARLTRPPKVRGTGRGSYPRKARMPGRKRTSGARCPFSQFARLACEQPILRATCRCGRPRSRRTRRRCSPKVCGLSG